MRALPFIRSPYECAIALCEGACHVGAGGAGVGHEEYQRIGLALFHAFGCEEVVHHGLACGGVGVFKLAKLWDFGFDHGLKCGVGRLVDDRASAGSAELRPSRLAAFALRFFGVLSGCRIGGVACA